MGTKFSRIREFVGKKRSSFHSIASCASSPADVPGKYELDVCMSALITSVPKFVMMEQCSINLLSSYQ